MRVKKLQHLGAPIRRVLSEHGYLGKPDHANFGPTHVDLPPVAWRYLGRLFRLGRARRGVGHFLLFPKEHVVRYMMILGALTGSALWNRRCFLFPKTYELGEFLGRRHSRVCSEFTLCPLCEHWCRTRRTTGFLPERRSHIADATDVTEEIVKLLTCARAKRLTFSSVASVASDA